MDEFLTWWNWYKANWDWVTPYLIILVDKLIEWISGGKYDLVRSVLVKVPSRAVVGVKAIASYRPKQSG